MTDPASSEQKVQGAFAFALACLATSHEATRASEARLGGIVGSAMDAIVSVDGEQRIVLFNTAAEKMFRCPAAEVIGQPLERLIPTRFREKHRHHVEGFGKTGVTSRSMRSLGTLSGLRADGEEFPIEASISQVAVGGQKLFTVILRDITARQAAEDALRRRSRQQQAIAELGQHALAGRDLARLIDDAVVLLPLVLGVESCCLFEWQPESGDFSLRAGAGWKEGFVGHATVHGGIESQAGFTLLMSAPVVVEDLARESRFRVPSLLLDHGIVSSITVVIHGRGQPFGVLGVASNLPRTFSEDDVHFVQSVANVLAAAIERRDLEEELLAISEAEQRRIGQDLHDGLCQHLAGLEFRTEALARDLEDDPVAREEVATIGGLIRDGTRQARMLARGLAPVEVEANGLISALSELATSSSHLYRIDCQLHCERPVLLAKHTTATHLFRIAQEAISNAVRHGHAQTIVIELKECDAGGVLTITSDGAPLPEEPGRSGGMGLHIMRYRSEMIGAALSIGSTAEGRTAVVCTFRPDR